PAPLGGRPAPGGPRPGAAWGGGGGGGGGGPGGGAPPVPLVFTVTKFSLGADTVTVSAEAVLDRRLLGLRAPEFLIGRCVTIAIHVVLRAETP
uniref:hypothetical protein n=1 Tax=Nocardia neocaledoniensis TaxID=236511 RepID=UPI00245504F7